VVSRLFYDVQKIEVKRSYFRKNFLTENDYPPLLIGGVVTAKDIVYD